MYLRNTNSLGDDVISLNKDLPNGEYNKKWYRKVIDKVICIYQKIKVYISALFTR